MAVLLAEHATDGGGLHGAEHEARERHGQELVQLAPAHVWQSERRQALRDLTQQRHTLRLEVQEPRREHAGHHHEKGHGPVLQPELAGNEDA